MASYNQLSLLESFDKFTRRDERLVDELVRAIGNFKYFRVNVRYTDFPKKKEMEDTLSQILYWTAWIAWKKAKYVDAYKADYNLDRFLALTKDASHINVTDIKSQEEMTLYFRNAHKRLKTMFMAYRDILQNETDATKRILRYFDEIHTLTYVI